MTQLPRVPSDLRQAMSLFTREISAGIACVQVATVVNFYAGPPATADVQLNMAQVTGFDANQNPISQPYAVFQSVPVFFSGGGGANMTFPVKPGDGCLLLFVDRDLTSWYLSGQQGLPPASNRLHDLSDAIALVGLTSAVDGIPDVSLTDTHIGGVTFAGKVKIYNSTGSLVTALNALCTALTGWIDTHGDTPTPVTIANINAAKTEIDAVLS